MLGFNSPKLSINVDSQKLYTSGDNVCGSLQMESKKDVSINEIAVKLVGIAESKSTETESRYNQSTGNTEYITNTGGEQEILIDISEVLFPPPEVRKVSIAKELTVLAGIQHYDFNLTFPDGIVYANSTRHQKFREFGAPILRFPMLSTQKSTVPVTLPPSFSFFPPNGSARVSYFIKAGIKRKKRFDIITTIPIKFKPKYLSVSYSLDHIMMDENTPLPDLSVNHSYLKYKISKDKRKKEPSFFKRIFSARSIRLPFELAIEFFQHSNVQDPSLSKRLLFHQHNIEEFCNLSLLMPILEEALRDALSGDEKNKDPQAPLSLRIVELKIILWEHVNFIGIRPESRKRYHILASKKLDLTFQLSDFEKVHYNGYGLIDKVMEKQRPLVSPMEAFKLELPREIYSCKLDTDAQSFLVPNIKTDISLEIVLTALNESNHSMLINCSTPILLLPDTDRNPLCLEQDETLNFVSPPEYPPPDWDDSNASNRDEKYTMPS